MDLLAGAGVTVQERTVTPHELESAREIFSTGNYGKVTPCVRYGGLGEPRELSAGPVARQARELYLAFTEST
jgi:branched-chain amino acid aminotransferase